MSGFDEREYNTVVLAADSRSFEGYGARSRQMEVTDGV